VKGGKLVLFSVEDVLSPVILIAGAKVFLVTRWLALLKTKAGLLVIGEIRVSILINPSYRISLRLRLHFN
jgi:uncharacterized protein (DUF486 family)